MTQRERDKELWVAAIEAARGLQLDDDGVWTLPEDAATRLIFAAREVGVPITPKHVPVRS